jgi:N-acetylmuramoyl-L-alanine amidase
MIYLVAGHNALDSDAIGVGGVKGSELTMELRDKIAYFITLKGYNVVLDNDYDNLNQIIFNIESNEKNVICDIRFNTGVPIATGTEVIIPDRSTSEERMIASLICSEIAVSMQIKSRGVKSEKDTARKKLAIMNPSGINLLLEVCFITNKNDLKEYQSKKDEIAEKIAKRLITAEDIYK